MPNSPSPPPLDPFPPLAPQSQPSARQQTYAAIARAEGQVSNDRPQLTMRMPRMTFTPSRQPRNIDNIAATSHLSSLLPHTQSESTPSRSGPSRTVWSTEDVDRDHVLDDLGGNPQNPETNWNDILSYLRDDEASADLVDAARSSEPATQHPSIINTAPPSVPVAPFLSLNHLIGIPSPPPPGYIRLTNGRLRPRVPISNTISTIDPDEPYRYQGGPTAEDENREVWGWYDSSVPRPEGRGNIVPEAWRSRFADGVPASREVQSEIVRQADRERAMRVSMLWERPGDIDSTIPVERDLSGPRNRTNFHGRNGSEIPTSARGNSISNITNTDPRPFQSRRRIVSTRRAAPHSSNPADFSGLSSSDLLSGQAVEARELESSGESESEGNEVDIARTRGSQAIYTHSNRTQEFMEERNLEDGPVSFLPDGPPLSRGSNNRSRRNTIRWETPSSVEAEISPTVMPGGRSPTNVDLARSTLPVVVGSRSPPSGSSMTQLNPGVRRRRSSNSNLEPSRKPGSWSHRHKKPRLESFDKQITSFRSSYLTHSSLHSATRLPGTFMATPEDSHLSVFASTSPIYKSSRPASLTDPTRGETLPSLSQIITYLPNPHPLHSDDDSSSLRTVYPIPVECGVHYFEVEVLNAGVDGLMSVGWMKEGCSTKRLVGWDKGSWGFHSDDGKCFEGRGSGDAFDKTWSTGDVIGCGVDFTLGRAFFTRNGKMIRHCFSGLGSGLYPAVGLKSSNETLAINFCGPFIFEIDEYVKNVASKVCSEIVAKPVFSAPRLADQVIPGHREPANSFPRSRSVKTATLKDAEKSKSIAKKKEVTGDVVEKVTAAFVLDYLKHNGLDRSLALTKLGMQLRKTSISASSSNITPIKPKSLTSHSSPVKRHHHSSKSFEDFSSPFAALNYVVRTIENSDTRPIPWTLISSMHSTFADQSSSLRNRLRIYEFLRMLQHSQIVEDEDEGMPYSGSHVDYLAEGRKLVATSKSENWNEGDKRDLNEAFGLVASPELFGTGISSKASREKDAQELMILLRREWDL